MDIADKIKLLETKMQGEVCADLPTRIIYSTDASAYKQMPLAVAWPKSKADIKELIGFAKENKTSLIPRGAGTSLAGQVVGGGIVVDTSKHFTKILEVNEKEKWARVQPGVVLDELNLHLKKHGLFFGPETSTANRCNLGGMVGNNACGSHSLVYGSTRDHTLEIRAILSDGSEVVFNALGRDGFSQKCNGTSLENKIYQNIHAILSEKANQDEIAAQYPEKSLRRRNTGYALDLLLDTELFTNPNRKFSFTDLLCGSEGTLALTIEIKLNLVPLPPKEKALLCAHFETKEEAFHANLVALTHNPQAVELMDHNILELTEGNIEQSKNRFFVKGQPAAILMIELARETRGEIEKTAQNIEKEMKAEGFGYHFPVIWGAEINKVWALRKAGLGLLSNMVGDAKPVSLIEDTAVGVEKLPAYLNDFEAIMEKHGKKCVYHAHIGTGELHLRPVLNLKDKNDVELFHTIGLEVAQLVKKHKGSLSGEHGDGRLRGEFIPVMLGHKVYGLLKQVKNVWDPHGIFNPGKITDTPKMNTQLRYEPGKPTPKIKTIFNFDNVGGIVRAAEKCNGSGDCRKMEIMGGTLCPSYMATRDEQHVTRARANLLREFLSKPNQKNPFNHPEIYNALDLCLSCKACKSECPSSVDMAKLKAEFLQHYYDANGIPLRSRLIAYITLLNKLGSLLPGLFNAVLKNKFTSGIFKKLFRFAKNRSIPLLYQTTLTKWIKQNLAPLNAKTSGNKQVCLFVDEFTNYNDVQTGIKTILLLNKLGYFIVTAKNKPSSRTFISKGLLRTARKMATHNVSLFKDIVNKNMPLIGIEPSAILSFRDEYPELVDQGLVGDANQLASNCFLVDEFLVSEFENGAFDKSLFTSEERRIILHGHCQQKAISSTFPTKKLLSIPENYQVVEIPSGCCGMAGSFGYEKEHYEISMKVGELVLFPKIRESGENTLISAPGTSCRHQIKDGTGRKAFHPAELLYDALVVDKPVYK